MAAISLNPFSKSLPVLLNPNPKAFFSSPSSPPPPKTLASQSIPPLSPLLSSISRKLRPLLLGGRDGQHLQIEGRDCLCAGGIGTMLMSTTAAAAVSKSKVSPFLWTLAGNPTFVSGLVAWALAQSMKVFLNFFVEKRWDFGMLFNSGGMPSSHSALCMGLTSSVALCHGVADSLFPVCLGFSLIVMYDAIGVRRHAGMQAEVLNKIIGDLFEGHPISQRKLKELLGHTPSQVIAGALLGILVACFCCQGCIVPI
ncbi:hypothetical protein J5N97_019714 [Dioscorea zingiberensis]|uniref:Acid phosphatase/vanadium-dependent haloperoxidase-related protein n=1 Tax=Dioscorea zingiberensis TaxID=325984 RepID=A0A9D5CGI5_9LILI|nr:hypothetical protein J5N97_019714 [Dioscorea zingiberensis]